MFPITAPDSIVQEIADLHGLSVHERVRHLIEKCAHPDYKPHLKAYLKRAKREFFAKGIRRELRLPFQAYNMDKNLQGKGAMKTEGGETPGC